MTRKVPRARAREGRPSFALGDQDHRVRKTQVSQITERETEPLETLEVPAGASPQQVRLIETLNRIVEDYNANP